MPTRISGLSSGLDTESLVQELVSAYSKKKDKYVKAQTKLGWKQEKWKSLNTKVKSFHSSIMNMRFSSAYNLKTISVSDNTKAKVTASGSAMNGVQSLQITQLAKSGYLTGARLNQSNITENSTLRELGFDDTGSVTIKVGEKTKDIQVDGSKKVSDFIKSLQEGGVNASFDEKNQRFFISAKESGAANDFVLIGNDAGGEKALQKMGISVQSSSAQSYDMAMKEFAVSSFDSSTNTMVGATKVDNKWQYDENATKAYVKYMLKSAQDAKNGLRDNQSEITKIEGRKTYLENYEKAKNGDQEAQNQCTIYEQNNTSTEDANFILRVEGAADATERAAILNELEQRQTELTNDNTSKSELVQKVSTIYDMDQELSTDAQYDEAVEQVMGKIQVSVDRLNNDSTSIQSTGATRVNGQDAIIYLNGAEFCSNTNTFSINGLNITATGVTGNSYDSSEQSAISISTATDAQGIYDKVKDFLTQYNDIINEMTSLYNADSAKGYEPLTDDEKSEMSDKEVEKWEEKIKESLLRRDTNLSTIMSAMQNAMAKSYQLSNGKSYAFVNFGVHTLSYMSADKNKQNAYHIDGDEDDASTSSNKDKLMEMIQEDPDSVVEFMKQAVTGVYQAISDQMKGTTLRSSQTIYNDKEMETEYKNYTKTIKEWEQKVSDMEDSYYKKFAAMESALANLQSNSSALSGLLS